MGTMWRRVVSSYRGLFTPGERPPAVPFEQLAG